MRGGLYRLVRIPVILAVGEDMFNLDVGRCENIRTGEFAGPQSRLWLGRSSTGPAGIAIP
jgi:hypothetical protein